MLPELSRERLYESVAQAIKKYIVDSGLQAGDALPSERQLCQRLNVGRTSLREGLRLLQMMGLVEIKLGRGTYVRRENLDSFLARAAGPLLLEESDILDLAEIREPLEIEAVRLAVDRRTRDHLDRIRAQIEQDRQKLTRGTYHHVDDDLEFHRLLFEASGNKALVRLIGTVGDLMRRAGDSGDQTNTVAEHTRIYEAIRDRKRGVAVRLMRDHVRTTTDFILSQIGRGRRQVAAEPPARARRVEEEQRGITRRNAESRRDQGIVATGETS